ncbi:uncharacterized protein LOC124935869 [Impatiens glandulifera]|uniref:uncharacterized protein LOC124935869 n=1 Tax=Impatiens glandulifera TaxID=253017 RepID=UPI001FB1163A|nr:uncharacterized protein LOC124935869 [Impatiens glandulifera]
MFRPSILRYLISLISLYYYFQSISVNALSTFSFSNFQNASKVDLLLDLQGHVHIVNDGSSLQINDGRILYRKPIKLFDERVSFSTSFSFSKFHRSGDSLAFVMIPTGFPLNKSLVVELSKHDHHMRIQIRTSHVNVSFPNLKHHSEKLRVWIDYQAGSRQLEIRLVSMIEESKPIEPLLSYTIDLFEIWKQEVKVFVFGLSGLMGGNSNSSKGGCNMYSWSFEMKNVPHWIHSEPVDPKALSKKDETDDLVTLGKKRDSLSIDLGDFIFGIACGAMGASIVLFLLMIIGRKSRVAQEEEECIEFDKLKVIENCKR